MKARLHDLSFARDGGYLLTIATRENVGVLYDELHETDVDVTVKKHREKRSLDANAYFWVLVDRLAEKTRIPNDKGHVHPQKRQGGRVRARRRALHPLRTEQRRACSARYTALTGRQRHRAEHRNALPLLPPSL